MPAKIELNEKDVIECYKRNGSLRATAYLFNTSTTPVRGILCKNSIIMNSSRKYYCDDNFFQKIDREDKAYFLGFLFADGSVRKRKRYINSKADCPEMKIKIHMKDVHILEKLNQCFKSTYPIKYSKGHDGTNCMASVTISSKKMVDDLTRHGCVPDKSLKLRFPVTVPGNLIRHFIRGYFDGDGCISRIISKTNTAHRMDFCGTKDMLYNIKLALVEHCGLGDTKIIENNKVYVVGFSINRNKNIFSFLYDGAKCFLIRKKNLFIEFEKYRKSSSYGKSCEKVSE